MQTQQAAIEQTEDLLVLFPCEKLVLDLSEIKEKTDK